MKIFITGGTGFIGSNLINQALVAGHQVLALRRRIESKPSVTLVSQPLWLTHSLNSICCEDLYDVDVIIHLAATGISPRTASWDELEEINVRGTLHMCGIAKQLGIPLVIGGSYSEYGLSGLRYERIPVSAPLEPTFPYAASKAAASLLANAYARSEGIRVSYLRIFNAFGDGQHHANLWPSLKNAALLGVDFPMTPGEQIRDFIAVDLVAKAFILESERLISKGQTPVVLNIGTGKPQSILSFCKYWWHQWQATGRLLIGELPYREGEVMRYVPEVTSDLYRLSQSDSVD